MNPNNKFQINPEEITWACPDSTWEYSEIWHQLQQAKKDIEKVLTNMQDIENVTLETDKEFRAKIRTIQSRLEYTVDILTH